MIDGTTMADGGLMELIKPIILILFLLIVLIIINVTETLYLKTVIEEINFSQQRALVEEVRQSCTFSGGELPSREGFFPRRGVGGGTRYKD